MYASLRALLTGLIDYAGLFPPAGLPLDQAIRNYARYRREPDGWMLGRFLCPGNQLAPLAPFVEELFDSEHPFHFSALGPSAYDKAGGFVHAIVVTVEAMTEFCEQQGTAAVGDTIEIRLPAQGGFLPILGKLAYFFEPNQGSNWRVDLNKLVMGTTDKPPGVGFKFRCGGLHASAFPPPEQIAFAVTACRDAQVPLKFTAGLHHPIRHYSAEVQTHVHGFINVFVAGVLAHTRGLNAEQLQPILEDEDAGDFVFDDEGLRWKDHRAATEEIVRARQMVASFGSCSFDEPRDDLRKLGWLP